MLALHVINPYCLFMTDVLYYFVNLGFKIWHRFKSFQNLVLAWPLTFLHVCAHRRRYKHLNFASCHIALTNLLAHKAAADRTVWCPQRLTCFWRELRKKVWREQNWPFGSAAWLYYQHRSPIVSTIWVTVRKSDKSLIIWCKKLVPLCLMGTLGFGTVNWICSILSPKSSPNY